MEDGLARHPAPGELELVRQFLNTYDVEEGIDEVSTPAGLRTWLAAQGLGAPRVGPADVARAIGMRESLRALALANNGEPLESGAIPAINSVAAGAHLMVRFDEHGDSVLEPAGE